MIHNAGGRGHTPSDLQIAFMNNTGQAIAETTPTVEFRPDGVLGKLAPPQLATLIGEVVGLMMASKVHRALQVRDIADIMLPALILNQFRIYRKSNRQPVAGDVGVFFARGGEGVSRWARFTERGGTPKRRSSIHDGLHCAFWPCEAGGPRNAEQCFPECAREGAAVRGEG